MRNNLVRPREMISHPLPFESTISVAKRFRFQASSALSAVAINQSDLFELLVVALTNVLGSSIIGAFKLMAVEMWGPMASSLTPVTVSCEFPTLGNGYGPTKVYTDTSMGATQVAHVRAAPPQHSLQSFWLSSPGADQFFILNGPSDTVIDLSIQYVLQNGESPDLVTLVGATAGQLYVRALDSTGSGLLVPLAYVTI